MGQNTVLITQARSWSTRLPGKVLKEVDGKTLLQIHLDRLNKCLKVDEIIVATTVNSEDDIIYNNALEWGFTGFKGSESNVLDRFYQSLKEINAKLWVIEDNKRKCEKDKDFGEEFIKLSRDVHFLNDDRAKIKLKINNHTGSAIKEIKEYTSY